MSERVFVEIESVETSRICFEVYSEVFVESDLPAEEEIVGPVLKALALDVGLSPRQVERLANDPERLYELVHLIAEAYKVTVKDYIDGAILTYIDFDGGAGNRYSRYLTPCRSSNINHLLNQA